MRPYTDVVELQESQKNSLEALVADEGSKSPNERLKPSPRFGSILLFKTWFPEVNPYDPREHLPWIVSAAVFVLNICLTAYAFTQRRGDGRSFVDILQPGKGWTCDTVRLYNRWLHFAINALSTILLSASNYCSQLLVAPTRRDVDEAHSHKVWLDIGVQSIRNLRRVDSRRKGLWGCLMISSGLLHLFWNSAIFAATPFNTYHVGLVTADFLKDNTEWHRSLAPLETIRRNASRIPAVEKEECISRYAGKMAGLASFLIVSSNITMSQEFSFDPTNTRSSLLINFTTVRGASGDWYLSNDWMCSAKGKPGHIACTEKALQSVDDWTIAPFVRDVYGTSRIWSKVDYCLPINDNIPMDTECALRMSPTLLSVITALNLVKCICIAYTAYLYRYESRKSRKMNNSKPISNSGKYSMIFSRTSLHLVTVGDAIASFLDDADKHTRGLDLAAKKDFVNSWPTKGTRLPHPKTQPQRWFRAASKLRWCITISMCIILVIIVGILLGLTITTQRALGVEVGLASLWSYGVGSVQPWAVALAGFMRKLDQTSGFFFAVFFANMFQVAVSAFYMLYNNLLTIMVVGSEWNDYVFERKTLRVSIPQGIQRSNYFLSLPYKYSLPLMVCSGILHWLISQSIFVIQTVAFTFDLQRNEPMDSSSIGYSSISIVLAMFVGVILIVAIIIVGFNFKYEVKASRDTGEEPPYPMPLASTCSAAISANCHRHEEDKDCPILPVRWGYVSDVEGGDSGHFTFTTAGDVRHPIQP
ncbi:hypothetical protein DM02DRAFT_725568 [Periconia macrospinosa]|uniref:DUF6536 domain-containing protein n=1 Tax=Periconia macrospinosa TaxID=97972 RepID=A0A2V1E363_9PLEO|nr:hypothetical protein DM02DRAFT_725568 [Periconia macrospinosa]